MAGSVKSKNVVWSAGAVSAHDRQKLLGQRGCVVWLTGLSGSGKSTIARGLESALTQAGHLAYVLDGDNLRHGLNRDLGFSAADRDENIRRVGEVAALIADAGVITIAAFISPFRKARQAARKAAPKNAFVEVYLDITAQQCAQRDPKGLYAKAFAGQIPQFTGVSSPYEAPRKPEVVIPTADQSIAQSVNAVLGYLRRRGFLSPPASPSAAKKRSRKCPVTT